MAPIFRVVALPAEDGDCLFVEVGDSAEPFRLLIDGGRASLCGAIRRFLDTLARRARPTIDVMVLSHVDADHIEGLLALLATETALTVGDVWFNGKPQMAAVQGLGVTARPLEAAATRRRSTTDVLSIGQGLLFSDHLVRRGWPWNAAFDGGPIMTEPDCPLPTIELSDGAQLTIFGPPKRKLEIFAPSWASFFSQLPNKSTPMLSSRPRSVPTVHNLSRIAAALDKPDEAKPNGSSIAFAIRYRGKSALFTADAHPDDIVTALGRYDGAAHFDLIKAAHHGSARNNTSRLTNLITGDNWLISTNGSRHGHPDPEAIARVLLAPGSGKRLIFNYRSPFNKIWSERDLQEAFSYRTRYPAADEQTIVDVMSDAV